MKTRLMANRIVLLVSIEALLLTGAGQVLAMDPWTEPKAIGDMYYYVHNWNGNALANDGVVRRYDASWIYLDQRSTDVNGMATWLGINTGLYNFESYYSGPGGQEYWGDDSYDVVTGSNTHHFYRFMPYSNSQWIGDTGGVPRNTFNVGETVRTKITVKNDVGVSMTAKVRCAWDRNQATPYDFDQTTSLMSISGGGGTRIYTFDYSVPSGFTGLTLRLAYWITTRLLSGNDLLTDSWVWSTLTFSVANRVPDTPSTPAGPGSSQTGVSNPYSTSGTDLDGDNVKYTFDWDDGTTTDTSYGVSGWTGGASHSWSSAGTYLVRAKTVDTGGLSSGWSPSKTVIITSTGDLDYYVHNWNGNLLANDGLVKRYDVSWNYIDERTTDASGKATWNGLDLETYNFESYYNGPGGQEYWGDYSLLISAGPNTHHFYRFLPYSTDNWVGDTTDTARTSFNVGETVRTKITVKNDAGAALDAEVRCVWDRDLITPNDFDQTSTFQTVTGGGGTHVFTFEYAVLSGFEGSSLTLAYWVTTHLLSGNDVLTDSWVWSTSTITIDLQATGDLDYYVYNWNGDILANDGLVKRYDSSWIYIDQKSTDTSGKASWTAIPTRTYNFETYYDGPGGQELWGDASVAVVVGFNTHHFYRFMPYSSDQWIGDTTDTARTSFNVGETVRTRITVKNLAGSALDARVRCVWDRDLITPNDFDQTSTFQTVTGGGGTATFPVEYTIPSGIEGSTLTLAYWVTTHLLSGNDMLTDSWVWSSYTIGIGGAQFERPVLLLTFDVESDDTNPSSGHATPLTIQAISDIAALLESTSLVGTFFIQGACYDNVVSGDSFMTEVEKVMLRNEIGSHSYSHAAMGSLPRSDMAFQLTDAEFALEMKLYGFRGPYFDISSDLQDELSVEEYIYDVSIWNGGENTPYFVNTLSGSLFEVPWRASDHDTSYAVLTQVIDNYVASGQNLTMVFHPQYVAADWTGFSNLVFAVSNYASTSQVEVITALSAVNRVRGNSLPDLSVEVSDIYFNKHDPIAPGSTMDIKYTIHNLGGSDASNFIVRLFDGDPNSGGSQIGSDVVIASLGPSLAMRNGAQWVATSSGQHDIYIQIDPSNALVETREDNNLAYRSISVVSSGTLSISLTGSTASGTVPLLVDFAAHTSGGTAPYLYYWEFGDGDYIDWAAQDTASKTYSQPGLFEARVMAKDSIGQTSDWTDPWQITVFKSSVNQYVSELIVTTDRNIASASIVDDITTLVDFADENEIAALSLLVKEDEMSGDGRIMSGQIFYLETDSEFGDIKAPGYEHVDVLQTVIEKAHEVGIKVYAWIPVFTDEFALSKNPSWRLDPANEDARQYQLERVREVLENYDVDGVRLDHLRYPTGVCLLFPTLWIAEKNIEKFTSDVRDIVDDTQQLKRRDILLGAYLQGQTRSWSVCQSHSLLEPYLDDVMPLLYWQDLAFNATWPGPTLPLDKNNALTDLFWRLKATFNPEETYQEWLEDWSTNVPSRYISNELNEMGDISPSRIVPVYSMTRELDYFDVANWKSETYWIPESDTLDFFEVSAAKSRDFGINRFALYYYGKLEGPGSIESRIPMFLASANDVMTGLSSPTSTPPDISPFNGGWHDLIYRKTLIWLGSPANMTVTNSEDDMFGIDREGNLYDEIAGSLVSYVATNKTYILPDDCYNVRIEGLDSGEYDLVISRLNGTSVERAAFLDVPVDASTDDVVTFGCQVKEVSIMTEDDEKNFDFEVFIGDDESESEFEATNLRIRKGETQSYDYGNVDSSDTTVEMKLDEGSDGIYEYTYTMNDGTDGGEIDYPKEDEDTDLTMVAVATIAVIISIVVSLLLLNRRRRSKPEKIESDEKARDEEEEFRET